jgi:membrane-associated phospholipid phosphatase
MRHYTRSTVFLTVGTLLIVAGVLSWQLGWDLPLHKLLRLPGTAWTQRVIQLSALGGFLVMGSIALASVLYLLIRRRTADALWLFVTIALGRLAVEGFKLILLRPRPPVLDRLELVTSWSFPSSHSAGTMMTCLALATLYRGRWPLFVAIAAALAIGGSRVALAVHWPGDVLAGWGIGLVWVGLALRFRAPQPIKP